ncbi:MAG: hypothetical protein PVJ15_02145 [Gammaproteobacteria bacterium]|jgi:hypothetical protein
MSGFPGLLKLKGRAEENIYFAKRDLELIRALHERELAMAVEARGKKQKKLARSFEKKYRKITRAHRGKPGKLLKAYRKLIRKIRTAFGPRGRKY